MAEWSKARPWKGRVSQGTVGSNPTLSAKTISYRHDPSNSDEAVTRVPIKVETKTAIFHRCFCFSLLFNQRDFLVLVIQSASKVSEQFSLV